MLALRCGADTVVDPREESPYDVASTRRTVRTAPQLLELAVGSMDRLRRVPGWVHLYRAAELAGAADAPRPVVFECVGTPGMIDGVLSGAPMGTRVVVVVGRYWTGAAIPGSSMLPGTGADGIGGAAPM